MPVHPEIKEILDSIPPYDPNHKVIPEEHRRMFDAPILPVEQRVQVYEVEEKTVSTPEADITVRIYTPEEGDSFPVLHVFPWRCILLRKFRES